MKICCDTGADYSHMSPLEKLSCNNDHCTGVVTFSVSSKRGMKYHVYMFDMWMVFDNQHAYLNWLEYIKIRR